MTSKQSVKPQDIELFRQLMRDVTPIVQNTAEPTRTSRKRQQSAVSFNNETDRNTSTNVELITSGMDPVSISATDNLLFKRSGIQEKVFRKLRRGQFNISAVLDLHGMTAYKARIALDQFMARMSHTDGQSCIQIIHGKGYGSRDGFPVIKQNVQSWLQCNKNVLAYCSCRPQDGGTGAIYVLLKNMS